MKEKKEDDAGLTRRDFLYLTGAGVAGMAVAGMPESGHGEDKKPK